MSTCVVPHRLGNKGQFQKKPSLQEGDLSLKTRVDTCHAAEATSQQLKSLKLADETIAEACSVSARDQKPHKSKARCRFCGQMHVLKKELCPARGKVCSACNKRNHFAVICMTKRPRKNLHLVENDSESEDEELLSVGNKQPVKVIKAEMII